LISEFSLIQRYFEQLTPKRDDVILGIGDDCALLQCPADHLIAVSIDTLVEDVHFFADVDPLTLGHKSLAVGLSDLAAMGVTPAWFTLALTLPEFDEQWLQGFSQGLAELAQQYNIQLVGGDTTRGPLSISIQVHGHVPTDLALQRDKANVGDMIYVSGTLGDAGAALQMQLKQWHDDQLNDEDKSYLQHRLECPTPQLELGEKLRGIASAAIDISDGLVADLGHILNKSNVSARLDLSQLPLSSALAKIDQQTAQQFALYSGDDYELCFTVPPQHFAQMQTDFKQCTRIGVIIKVIKGSASLIYGTNFQAVKSKIKLADPLITLIITGTGYDHFK